MFIIILFFSIFSCFFGWLISFEYWINIWLYFKELVLFMMFIKRWLWVFGIVIWVFCNKFFSWFLYMVSNKEWKNGFWVMFKLLCDKVVIFKLFGMLVCWRVFSVIVLNSNIKVKLWSILFWRLINDLFGILRLFNRMIYWWLRYKRFKIWYE